MQSFSELFHTNTPVFTPQSTEAGKWELDLKTRQLQWSPEQYRLYGYQPGEISLNDDFFIVNTTHSSDLRRIKTIIDQALTKSGGYRFKRRIIRKDGSLGFVETVASIIRSKNGMADRIIGSTTNVAGECINGVLDYNDPAFFVQFYSLYKKLICAEIRKWTYDEDLAKDLCQEIFIKAWTHLSKYDADKAAPGTWLMHITKNHCKDYLRSKYFRHKQLTQHEEVADQGNTPDMEHLLVKELLQKLPDSQREVVDLLFMQGYSQTEVAILKNLPLGTVKSRSKAALKTLRGFLRPA